MSKGRFVFCEYADDLREEVGGKFSLIGVYRGGMRVAATPPVVLPKLVVIASLSTPAEHPFTALSFRVLWRGKMLQDLAAPQELLHGALTPGATQYIVQVVIAMQAFTIDGPGRIQVIANVDGEELHGNALTIEVVPASSGAGQAVAAEQ